MEWVWLENDHDYAPVCIESGSVAPIVMRLQVRGILVSSGAVHDRLAKEAARLDAQRKCEPDRCLIATPPIDSGSSSNEWNTPVVGPSLPLLISHP